jgi:hypothetical protein
MNHRSTCGPRNNNGRPSLGQLLSKLDRLSHASDKTLCKSTGKGVLENTEGIRETQVKPLISLKLTD